MIDPHYFPIIAWVGLVLLFLLCLPFAVIPKLVLEVYAWVLRLALLGAVGAAAYLWFHPGELPASVTDTLNNWPQLMAILPEPGTPLFGIGAAALIVVVLLPLLAILDVNRRLTGWRRRALAAQPTAGQPLPPSQAPGAPRANRTSAA
jgi:hypothetical protein